MLLAIELERAYFIELKKTLENFHLILPCKFHKSLLLLWLALKRHGQTAHDLKFELPYHRFYENLDYYRLTRKNQLTSLSSNGILLFS